MGVQTILYRVLLYLKRRNVTYGIKNYVHKMITLNAQVNELNNKDGLNKWVKKWSVFGGKLNPEMYKFFHHYIGDNVNIVPGDISQNFIEPVLTPQEFQPFYNDKNSFGLFIPKEMMPTTYFRVINGLLYDGEYNAIDKSKFETLFEKAEKLIVKPSKDMGGHGISLFTRDNKSGWFQNSDGNKLTLEFLLSKYKRDFLVQECLKQSSFMAQFNPTSVNTLRLGVYRDIKTGELRLQGAVLRIGGKGSFVDNITSGGSSTPIDVENGKLGKYTCDISRVRHSVYNDINFADNEFIVPNWDKIKTFVFEVARHMPHMCLFANDVALDENGNPVLIEVNTTNFTYTIYQVNGKPFYGEYTNDVIEYCYSQQKNLKPHIILKME